MTRSTHSTVHHVLAPLILAQLLAASALAVGCAIGSGDGGDGSRNGDGNEAGAGIGLSGVGANGQGGGDAGSGTGATVGWGGGSGDGRYCTTDLRAVVDDAGHVLETCEPDEGCYRGECVPACAAAESHDASMGCGFVVPSSPFTGAGWPGTGALGLRGPCHAAFVANGWHRPAKLSLRYGGHPVDVSAHARIPSGNVPYPSYEPIPDSGLPPGEVAIVFLSHDPQANNDGIPLTCPVTPAVTQDTAVTESGRGSAFELTSDTPITAYDILPYGGAWGFLPSATLLLPKHSLGDNYVVVAPHDDASDPIYGGQLWLTLAAGDSGATVQVRPPTTLPAGPGVSSAPAGVVSTFSLGPGETLQWLGGGSDPTGTLITSNAPIAVFAGSTYLWVTAGESLDGGRDAAHQQLEPVNAMAHEYVGAGVVTRRASLAAETSVYRLVGVVSGTELAWDPARPPGAPNSLQPGQVVEFATDQLFHVQSQDVDHPFSLTQYMTGSLFGDYMRQDGTSPKPIGVHPSCGIGDEEWVRVLSPAHFLPRYVFFTDPKYATTNLVITRRNDGAGFRDVHIECLGIVSGWQPVGSSGRFQVAHVDLVRRMEPAGQCETSRHEATSAGAFGITVWGTDWCSSYAYPAGGSFRAVNGIAVVP